MNRSESTLIRWINLWNQDGIDTLVPKPKPGQPPKISKENRKRIVDLMNDPKSSLLENGDLEVWFGDESSVFADPRPRPVWAVKDSKTK
ncbi:MAG: helix-turn-helix domain-containing protein [Calditrichaeota bacterium]|nr:helix-turn-helix domain-containing protein [Calditrichota bacterium]